MSVSLLFVLAIHASVHWHPSDGTECECPVCSIVRLGTFDRPVTEFAGTLLLCAALISYPSRNDSQPAANDGFHLASPRSPPR